MTGITNAQGGPDRLKLRVFSGTSAPSAPKDNDIWVNTNIPIGGYKFSGVSHPTWSNGVSGYVYFTSTFTDAETYEFSTGISFTKNTKCGIYARLLQCWQYNGNEYTRKDAYIYHEGWHQFSSAWNGELLDGGDQYTGVTGGWKTYYGTISEDTGYLYATGTSGVRLGTASTIDMTGYSQLHVIGGGYGEYTESGSAKNITHTVGVSDDPAAGTFLASASLPKAYGVGSVGEVIIDISNISGSHYVSTTAWKSGVSAGVYLTKVWMT